MTEKGLQYLSNNLCEADWEVDSLVDVLCCSTSCTFQPISDNKMLRFSRLSTNPLIEVKPEYSDSEGTEQASTEHADHCLYGKVVVINDDQQPVDLVKALVEKSSMKRQSLEYKRQWHVGRWQLSILSTTLDHVSYLSL